MIKDMDGDNIVDTVRIDSIHSRIVCRLSTQEFNPVTSKEMYISLDDWMGSRLIENEKGFTYSYVWMRMGESYDFEYDADSKRIRLVRLDYYYFGNAAGNGKEESSIDLLSGECSGIHYYYDYQNVELIAEPYSSVVSFPHIYLEDFYNGIQYDLDLP